MKQAFFKPLLVVVVAALVTHSVAEVTNAQRGGRGRGGGSGWKFVAGKYDTDKDGSVSLSEYTRGEEAFKALDNNGDGVLNEEDWSTRSRSRGGASAAPEVGEQAPDFSLTEIRNAENTVTLSSFAGKKPVALLFGSCT